MEGKESDKKVDYKFVIDFNTTQQMAETLANVRCLSRMLKQRL